MAARVGQFAVFAGTLALAVLFASMLLTDPLQDDPTPVLETAGRPPRQSRRAPAVLQESAARPIEFDAQHHDPVEGPACAPALLEGSILDESGRGLASVVTVLGVLPPLRGESGPSGRILLEAPHGFPWDRHAIRVAARGWVPIDVSASELASGLVLVPGSRILIDIVGDDARSAELVVIAEGPCGPRPACFAPTTPRESLTLPADLTSGVLYARTLNGCSRLVDVDASTADVTLEIQPYVSLAIAVPSAPERQRLGLTPRIHAELRGAQVPPEGFAEVTSFTRDDDSLSADASSGRVTFPYGDTAAAREWTAPSAGATYAVRYADELDTIWLDDAWHADAQTTREYDVPTDGWNLDRTRWAARVVVRDAEGPLDTARRTAWGASKLEVVLSSEVDAERLPQDDGATFVVEDASGQAPYEVFLAERLVARGTLSAGQVDDAVVDLDLLADERGLLLLPADATSARLHLRGEQDSVTRLVPADGVVPLLAGRWDFELERDDGAMASGSVDLCSGGTLVVEPSFLGDASLTVGLAWSSRRSSVLVYPVHATPDLVRSAQSDGHTPVEFAGLPAGLLWVRAISPSRPGFARLTTRRLDLCRGTNSVELDVGLEEHAMTRTVLHAPDGWDLLVVGPDDIPWAAGRAPLEVAFPADETCRVVASHQEDGSVIVSPLSLGVDGDAHWAP